MRGEILGVWSETWREIWVPLVDQDDVPEDVFCELYRALSSSLKTPLTVEQLADIIDDPAQSRDAFDRTTSDSFSGERALVVFMEKAYEALDEFAGDKLSNHYFNLLSAFIDKFSLRYDLRRPCTMCPTLPGIFASLVRDLRVATLQDSYLDGLMQDFEEAVRDLRTDCSDRRIKTCIQKQVNLLEGLGSMFPGVQGNTLLRIRLDGGPQPDYLAVRREGKRAPRWSPLALGIAISRARVRPWPCGWWSHPGTVSGRSSRP